MSDERDAQGKCNGDEASRSVHSFSQLPFVSLTGDKPLSPPPTSNPAPPIRLFGFDVPPEAAATTSPKESTTAAEATHAPIMARPAGPPGAASSGNNGGGGGRRFECRYCCRNFRTSQALGGHQNAHKEERQHAKRARFQTAMAMRHYQLPLHPAHLYRPTLPPPPHYPAWAGAAYYVTPGPITNQMIGSPAMPKLWRPRAGMSLLGRQQPVLAGSATFSSASWPTSPGELPTLPELKENVSLDLSL